MKRIFKRFITVLPAFALQGLWFYVLFRWLSRWSAVINLLLAILAVVFVLYIITKEDDGTYKMLWLLIILGSPVIGTFLYIVFGNKRTTGKLKKKLESVKTDLSSITGESCSGEIPDERMRQTFRYVEEISGFPTKNNEASRYYALGEELFADLVPQLKKAEHFIFMEYFIIEHGQMLDEIVRILVAKAREGVDVRLLYDDFGSISTFSMEEARRLREKGIRCEAFNPLLAFSGTLNYRDHRKMTVIDGRIAFTGGINIADEYINRKVKYGHWKDGGMSITGEAAAAYTRMFVEFWNAFAGDPIPERVYREMQPAGGSTQSPPEKTGQRAAAQPEGKGSGRQTEDRTAPAEQTGTRDGYVLSYCDSPVRRENISNELYIELLSQARERAYFFTPYLMLGDSLLEAFKRAAQRGVDVRILMPGIPDKRIAYRMSRSFYPPLLESGVRIYEYSPGFVHTKASVIDGRAGTIGTVNLDYRSLFLHFENNAFFYEAAILKDVESDFLATAERSREVRGAGPVRHGLRKWFIDGVLRIFSPLC